MPILQNLIHGAEEGGGLRFLKYVLALLFVAGLSVSYNLRQFKNMSNPEAMDAAQLARNIADHKGYNTLLVRPFSMYLLQRTYAEKHGEQPMVDRNDRTQIRGMHPDLANAPLYLYALAGLMKVFPKMQVEAVAGQKGALIYRPDFLISLFNQFLFLVAAIMVFFLARRRFDATIAWISAGLFLGTDLFWRFSIAGLSTMLLMVIFVGLAWCLSSLEEGYREGRFGPGRLLSLAILAGALTGLGGLTRYSFGWLILPVLAFLILFLGRSRIFVCLVALLAFAAVMSPWLARNYHVSHTPFGTAGYAIYETTPYFSGHRLERSLNPDLSRVNYRQLWSKFMANTRTIARDDLPGLGGGWIAAFFFAGLMVHFRSPTLNRLRYFLLLCLGVLIVVQALGHTQLSEDSPVVNSENLLVLLAPLVIIFGVGFFFTLLDQIDLPVRQLRYWITGAFCALICLPALFSLATPRVNVLSNPAYLPPVIQKTAGWMKESEMMMSDIPWAVAWYGQRQCLWLTEGVQSDFFSINDYQKPINAIFITPATMDGRFLTDWRNSEWGRFVLEFGVMKLPLPLSFPLRHALSTWWPDYMILMDYERWNQAPAP